MFRIVAVVFIAALTTVFAQSGANSGQIVGQILDPSGAAVTRADVAARNKNTNFVRKGSTDSAGRFAVSDLPLGPYEVTVQATGFQTPAREAYVTLGSSVSVNFDLSVARKSDSIEVNDAPGLEPTRSAPKSILTDLQIHQLPSNGRRLQNTVIQTPTALIEPECRG